MATRSPHRAPEPPRTRWRPPSLPGDEDVRGDAAGQLDAAAIRVVLTRHPHTIVTGHEGYLAPGLYPYVLESKHQTGVALDLLTYPPDDKTPGPAGRDLGHGLGGLVADGDVARPRLRGQAQLVQPGDEVPVRAVHRIAEQLHQPALDLLGYHVLPPAGLDVHLFPGQSDDSDQEALGQPVLAHDPGGQPATGRGQRELTVTRHLQQPVALHPGHRLADRGSALGEPLGDAGAQRDDTFLLEFENRAKVHLGRVDEPVRRHRSYLPP